MSEAVLKDITDKIYESLFFEEGRLLVINEITAHLGYGYGAWYGPHGKDSSKTFLAFKGPEDTLEPNADYYAALDQWHQIAQNYDDGSLINFEDAQSHIPHSNDKCNNGLTGDIFGSSGACALKINEKLDGLSAHVSLYKSTNGEGFDKKTKEFMNVLTPHFIRFDRLFDRVAGLEKRAAYFDETLNKLAGGVIVLDSNAKIISANRRAEKILQKGSGFSFINRKLSCQNRTDQEVFSKLLAQSVHPEIFIDCPPCHGMKASCDSAAGHYHVIVAPLGRSPVGFAEKRAAIVFIDDPAEIFEAPSTLLCDLYGLTPAESRVTLCVVQGYAVTDIANRLKIADSTVRYQVKQILSKTGAGRQG